MNEYYVDADQYYHEDPIIYEETVFLTYKYCMEPTMYEILPYILKLTMYNFIFRVVLCTTFVPKILGHVFSVILGVSLFYHVMNNSLPYILMFVIFCFIVMKICYWIIPNIYAYIVGIIYLVYLIGSELYFPIPSMWMETRGLHMVIAMKYISLMFDVQNKIIQEMPNIIEISGYILCPNNCILGPWVSYKSYMNLFHHQTKFFDFSWIKQFLLFFAISLMFLTISNCWAAHFIPQTFKWTLAFSEALSFRSSHYFISFLASSMLVMTDCGYSDSDNGVRCYHITNPFYIELPRSLVQVVVYWNMPMHLWLKKYIFRVSKPLGSFTAVIFTYLVSSFLHGFNAKLAAVLLSLGFYTYIEYEFRNKLSFIFDACIKANPCKKCNHEYKNNFYVQCTNIAFSCLAIFHLAYLGCLMEDLVVNSENNDSIFEKWTELGYTSHIVTASIYLFHKLI